MTAIPALADGTVLARPLAFGDIYGQFRQDWRVTTETQSLFSYDAGESLDGFYIPDQPSQEVTLDTLDPAARADAEVAAQAEAVEQAQGEGQIYILTASENGYGKRTRLEEFPLRGRGGQGVIAMQTSERNGSLVAAMQVYDSDEMMLITDRGTLVRTRVEEVSTTSRNTQGVMLIRLGKEEKLVKTVRVDEPEESDVLEAGEPADADNGAQEPGSDDTSL